MISFENERTMLRLLGAVKTHAKEHLKAFNKREAHRANDIAVILVTGAHIVRGTRGRVELSNDHFRNGQTLNASARFNLTFFLSNHVSISLGFKF